MSSPDWIKPTPEAMLSTIMEKRLQFMIEAMESVFPIGHTEAPLDVSMLKIAPMPVELAQPNTMFVGLIEDLQVVAVDPRRNYQYDNAITFLAPGKDGLVIWRAGFDRQTVHLQTSLGHSQTAWQGQRVAELYSEGYLLSAPLNIIFVGVEAMPRETRFPVSGITAPVGSLPISP